MRNKVLNTWGYRLEPKGDGTDVTEFFEFADHPLMKVFWRFGGKARAKVNREGMQTTLERIKVVVENN